MTSHTHAQSYATIFAHLCLLCDWQRASVCDFHYVCVSVCVNVYAYEYASVRVWHDIPYVCLSMCVNVYAYDDASVRVWEEK